MRLLIAGGTMASGIEQIISCKIRAILAELPIGASIAESEQFRDVLSAIEYFLPEVLGEIYPEWHGQCLDGIIPLVARKTYDSEAEIFGLGIIMSDQTVTPLHLRLQIDAVNDEISWLEWRLGERGEHGMMRTPYDSLNAAAKRFHALSWRVDCVDWVYKVTFGERRA